MKSVLKSFLLLNVLVIFLFIYSWIYFPLNIVMVLRVTFSFCCKLIGSRHTRMKWKFNCFKMWPYAGSLPLIHPNISKQEPLIYFFNYCVIVVTTGMPLSLDRFGIFKI